MLPISIKSLVYNFAVHVIEKKLHYSLIHGFDFMHSYKVKLDFETNTSICKDNNPRQGVLTQIFISCKLMLVMPRSAKSYTIQKQIKTIVMIKVSRRKPNDVVLLEPLDLLYSSTKPCSG